MQEIRFSQGPVVGDFSATMTYAAFSGLAEGDFARMELTGAGYPVPLASAGILRSRGGLVVIAQALGAAPFTVSTDEPSGSWTVTLSGDSTSASAATGQVVVSAPEAFERSYMELTVRFGHADADAQGGVQLDLLNLTVSGGVDDGIRYVFGDSFNGQNFFHCRE